MHRKPDLDRRTIWSHVPLELFTMRRHASSVRHPLAQVHPLISSSSVDITYRGNQLPITEPWNGLEIKSDQKDTACLGDLSPGHTMRVIFNSVHFLLLVCSFCLHAYHARRTGLAGTKEIEMLSCVFFQRRFGTEGFSIILILFSRWVLFCLRMAPGEG